MLAPHVTAPESTPVQPRPSARALQALLLGLVPVFPMLMVLWSYLLPPDAALVELAGPWTVTWMEEPTPASVGCTTVRLPGKFVDQKCSAQRLVVERTLALPTELLGHNLLLWAGGTGATTVEARVNGVPVGSYGDPTTGIKPSLTDEISFFVPSTIAASQTTVTLDIRSWIGHHNIMRLHDGLVSPRMILGRHTHLGPVFDRQASLGMLLRHGAALVLLFAAWLLAALLWLEWGSPQRDTYLRALALAVSTFFYVTPLTGAFFSLVPTLVRAEFLPPSVSLFLLTGMEFVEDHYLHRVTLLRRFTRVVLGLMLALWLVVVVCGLGDRVPIYDAILAYAMVVALYIAGLAVHGMWRTRAGMAPLLGMALVVLALSGVLTVLDEEGILHTPFFFDLAIANVPICATVVVISDFVRLSLRNRELSVSLSDANATLRRTLMAAEEANRVKGEFLAAISHEFRTPLNPIINLPEILSEEFQELPTLTCPHCQDIFEPPAGLDAAARIRCPSCGESAVMTAGVTWQFAGDGAQARRQLERVKDNGVALLGLLDRAMQLAALGRETGALKLEALGARGLVQGVVLAAGETARNARVSLRVLDGEDATVRANAEKLRLALLQLVDNAIKFSRPGGVVELGVTAEPEAVVLSVRDHGEGIAPQNLEIIFEAFRQADGSHTRRHGGVGMGLTLAKSLVEAHGGTIVVESTLGQGSTFRLRLPRQDGDGAPHRKAEDTRDV